MSSLADIFKKFGLILNNGEQSFNSFSVDPRKFQSNLIQFIQKSSDNPKWEKNYQTIWQNLEIYLDNETNFAVSLLPSKFISEQQTHSSNQDSVIKILLEISNLQSDLFDYLISKILNYLEAAEESANIEILGFQINIPSHIVSQFRYQPRINQPQLLCHKLIELINNTTNFLIKKEIIACFPDILCDCQHDGLVNDLELVLDEIELVSTTLDTLTNLSFKKENLLRITRTVLQKYPLLNEKDFPSCLKFILKALITLNDKDVFNDLRNKLKLDEITDDCVKLLVYDTFRENLQVSSQLVELYSTCIQYNCLAMVNNLILPFDFLLITLIYSIPQYSKSIEKLFKTAIKQETFKNVEKSSLIFVQYSTSFASQVLDLIQKLSKALIQSGEGEFASIGQSIIKYLFLNYEKNVRQQVLSYLLDLITNYTGSIRENSLDVLVSLTSKEKEGVLMPFQVQIRSLLDYIEYFNLSEIRKVYSIICSIAYSHPKPAPASISVISNSQSFIKPNSIQDNLNILINKQLSSNCLKHKQIGVIGALMLIKNMANRTKSKPVERIEEENESFFSCSSSQSSIYNGPGNSTSIQNTSYILSSIASEIKNIWDMILDSSRSSAESLGLFEDDLSGIVVKNSISDSLEILMKENLRDMSKNLFKLDPSYKQTLSKYSNELSSFRIGYEFGLDQRTHGALNLLPLILNDLKKKNSCILNSSGQEWNIPSIAVPSTFRLMCALERANLTDFVDYLGCPILSINKEDLLRFATDWLNKFKNFNDDEKKLVCNCIFYLINWFIELINAFSAKILDENFQQKNKLINRLDDICQLRNVLRNILSYVKLYRPPMVVFGLIDSSIDELPFVQQFVKENKAKQIRKKKVSKQGAKKEVKKSTDDNLFEDSDLEGEKTILEDSEDDQQITSEFDLDKISIYFREFDISLINFVNFDLNLDARPEKEPILTNLKPEHLFFVITDFNLKLSIILKSNSTKMNPLGLNTKPTKLQLFLDSNPVNVAELIDKFIDKNVSFIIGHLDSIQNHIRAIQDKNDGISDPTEISTNENNLFLLKIVNQILKMLQQIFSYLNSLNNQNKIDDLFKIIIKSVKIQSSSKLATQIDKLPDLVCFNYLAKLKDILMDLNSGHILIQLLDLMVKILAKKTDHNLVVKMKKILCTCAMEFLTNDYNPKINSIFSNRQMSNEAVVRCLNYLILNSDENLSVVEDLVKVICDEEFMLDRQNCGKYSTLKSHFLPYYKACLEFTVNELKFCSGDTMQVFSRISSLTKMHCDLILLKKSVAFRDINMLTVIKNSKIFLTNFTKYSMPFLDKAFDCSKQEIIILMQTIQKCVHYIQEILVVKDQAAIAKQAPIYNRTIEALMVRVQQLLYVNSFDGGFLVNFVDSKLKIGNDGSKKRVIKSIKKKKTKKGKNDSEIESEIEDDEADSDNQNENSDENED